MDQTIGQFGAREPGRVGERLAAARAALGLSLEEIAERSRVPKRHLAMIEAGSAEGLPALTYSAGFVRTYAGMVGLDGDDCARQFRDEMAQPMRREIPAPYEPADPKRIPSRLIAIVALLLAVAVAGGYAIWRGDGLFGGGAVARERLAAGTDPDAQPVAEATPLDAGAQPVAAPPTAAADNDGPVAVTATEGTWVRIMADGKSLFTGTMNAGQRIEIPADAVAPTIRTGRAQSLKVTVGTAMMQPLGAPDTLIRDASLRRADLLAKPAFPLVAAPLPAQN